MLNRAVLVDQTGAVDVRRLGDLVGHFSTGELWGVDEALLTVLGLDLIWSLAAASQRVGHRCSHEGRGCGLATTGVGCQGPGETTIR